MTAEQDAERIADLEEDDQRLRRLLSQRDAPGELRHRLRSTLGLLRSIVLRSATTGRELVDYVAHLEDRLDAITRAQALADQYGVVSLQRVLSDELLHYGASEGERLLLSGPEVLLQPRAGQVFALAVHELAVNSIEHGVLGAETGRVEVVWRVESGVEEVWLVFRWSEFGDADPGRRVGSGFGTEVLTRMLAYEFSAEPKWEMEREGLRYRVRMPLPERVGVPAGAAH